MDGPDGAGSPFAIPTPAGAHDVASKPKITVTMTPAIKLEGLTKAQTKARIQALGLVARWSAEWGEWRVTVPPGSMHHMKRVDDAARESMAIYTPDADDALGSAKAMRDSLERNPPPGFRAPWALPQGVTL